LANIIWEKEPIKSSELVKICEDRFNWKKSTTYTMLKRLEEKKIVENNNSIVEAITKKEDYHAEQTKIFVEENFNGSLPKFLAAFTRRRKLSKREIQEIERLINEYRGE